MYFSSEQLRRKEKAFLYRYTGQNLILFVQNILTFFFIFCIIDMKVMRGSGLSSIYNFDVRKRLKQVCCLGRIFFI